MKVLITGLPDAGKTTLANSLSKHLKFLHLNADDIRQEFSDWDFSIGGRNRQAKRMHDFAADHNGLVIADFVAPTDMQRRIYNPDYVIWMDTIDKEMSGYADTSAMYTPPTNPNLVISDLYYDVEEIANLIKIELDKFS